jgi:hypothetical protein
VQSVDVAPLVPELANFFDDVLNKSVSELNLKVRLTLHPLVCPELNFFCVIFILIFREICKLCT